MLRDNSRQPCNVPEIPILLTLLLKRVKGLPRFPEFRVELKRLLISSLGFRSTAFLLEDLTQPEVAFAGRGLGDISNGVGEFHLG